MSVRFTPAEFRLMRRLFATPGAWVARSELFAAMLKAAYQS
jgi:DNA-binding response OmpR family regulator